MLDCKLAYSEHKFVNDTYLQNRIQKNKYVEYMYYKIKESRIKIG